ncbi:MAG: hypothetical protein VXW89_05075, partial [Candidatus Thermoplasmatota archaeon]|nr:hypothetical protein [Candidatus Thermoplasmatota archaeon]
TMTPAPVIQQNVTNITNVTNIHDSAISGAINEVNSNAPPLPASGLPEGWTMEQWEHYGQQWVDQQGL